MIKEISGAQLKKLLEQTNVVTTTKRNQKKEIINKIKTALPNHSISVDRSYQGTYIVIDEVKRIIFYEVMHYLGYIVGKKIYPKEYESGLALLQELKDKFPTWRFGVLDDMGRHGTEVSIIPQ